jgi:hypothetical protein
MQSAFEWQAARGKIEFWDCFDRVGMALLIDIPIFNLFANLASRLSSWARSHFFCSRTDCWFIVRCCIFRAKCVEWIRALHCTSLCIGRVKAFFTSLFLFASFSSSFILVPSRGEWTVRRNDSWRMGVDAMNSNQLVYVFLEFWFLFERSFIRQVNHSAGWWSTATHGELLLQFSADSLCIRFD